MTVSGQTLIKFYSPPNEIDLASLQGPAGDLLHHLVARLDSGNTRTILPARLGSGTRWYGIAPSHKEARLLLEEMQAWLGPPISLGPLVVRRDSDELDTAALSLVPEATVFRVDVSSSWQSNARANVTLLHEAWTMAPERGIDQPRPVGRVLRQFYESLLAKDRPVSEDALAEIKARSLLSATNVRFLRIELLSALGTPSDLRGDPLLRGVTLTSRPPAVTDRLAVAADSLLIAPMLDKGGKADWKAVGQELEDIWPGLVTHPSQIMSSAGARCFLLAELLATSPRSWALGEVANSWGSDVIVRALVDGKVVAEEAEIPPGSPAVLYHTGHYSLALAAIDEAQPTRSAAGLALFAAINLGDPSSAAQAIGVVERLSEDDRALLLDQAVEGAFYDRLRQLTEGTRIPVGWVDWLRGDWPDRADLLREWASQWERSADEIASDAEALAGELLDALNDHRRTRVRNGLPILTEWILDADGLGSGVVALAVTILDILLSSDPGRVERQAVLELLGEILETGCSSLEYSEVTEAVRSQLGVIGPRDAAWLASVLSLLQLSAGPLPDRRAELIAGSLALVHSWGDRTEDTDELLLTKVFGDAGFFLPQRPPRSDQDVPADQPRAFSKVGIYSLLEPAAQAAARWIREMWPGTEVVLSHDHGNSRALEALVKSSDVMLVQTSRAKHAATSAIAAAAPDKGLVVFVAGRGATSLLRSLIDWTKGRA